MNAEEIAAVVVQDLASAYVEEDLNLNLKALAIVVSADRARVQELKEEVAALRERVEYAEGGVSELTGSVNAITHVLRETRSEDPS